jgi:hypothetical protein
MPLTARPLWSAASLLHCDICWSLLLHAMQTAFMPGEKEQLLWKRRRNCGWTNFRGRVDRVHGVGGIQDFIPNTPKESLLISPPTKVVPILKKRMTFNLTSEYETRIGNYVTEMLPFCLGPIATHVMRYVHHSAGRSTGVENPSIMYPILRVLVVTKNPTTECNISQTVILETLLFMSEWTLNLNIFFWLVIINSTTALTDLEIFMTVAELPVLCTVCMLIKCSLGVAIILMKPCPLYQYMVLY